MKNLLWFLSICAVVFFSYALLRLCGEVRNLTAVVPGLANKIDEAAGKVKAAAETVQQTEKDAPEIARNTTKKAVGGIEAGVSSAAKAPLDETEAAGKKVLNAGKDAVDKAKSHLR